MAAEQNESVAQASPQGDGRSVPPVQPVPGAPVPPEELAAAAGDQPAAAPAQPTPTIPEQPTAVAPEQPTAVAPAPVQPTAATPVAAAPAPVPPATPKQPMPKKKRTIIIVAAIVLVALVAFAIFRSVAASNASSEIHAALTSVAATNDSFGTVNNVCGEYYVGYATEDNIGDAQSALTDITSNLDAAQKHLDNAASFKTFASASDQAAYDELVTSISGRRAMVDAATKIVDDSESVVDARGSLSKADTDFYEAETDLSSAIDSCNSLDFNGATTSADDALAKLSDATDKVNAAKTSYPDADYSSYDNYISKFTDCVNTVIKIKGAVDANDASTYSSLVSQFNTSFSDLKSMYTNRSSSYGLFADILEKNEKDNVRAYKDGLNTAEKAEEALSDYAGMDMTIQSATSSYHYADAYSTSNPCGSSNSSSSSTVNA